MIRFIAVATVIIVAALVAPAAWVPVFNSADLILIAAPFAVTAIAWPRKPRAHFIERIDEDHPDALGSLDMLARQHD